jgi:molybdate transport system permease protein
VDIDGRHGVSLVIGVPLAWVLARTDFPVCGCCGRFVTLPLVRRRWSAGRAAAGVGRDGFIGNI